MNHLLLDRHTFVTRFGSNDPRNRVLRRLHTLLSLDDIAVAGNPIEWLEDLMGWLFDTPGVTPGRQGDESELDARTRLLVTALEEIPPFAERLRATIMRCLGGSSATHLFTDTGIPTHYGFWRELAGRFSSNVLPRPPVGREVSRLLGRLFDDEARAEWLLNMPQATRRKLFALTGLDSDGVRRALEPGLKEAMSLLSARIAMQGVSDDLRTRLPARTVASSPFLALPEQVAALQNGQGQLAKVQATIDDCRACLREVTQRLDVTGISVDLVFRLDLVSALLKRLSQLLTLRHGLEEAKELALVQLERELIQGTVADSSLSSLLSSSTRLLARRVVDRAGSSGEHYVTRTRSEQQLMLDAAVGGGAITAVMVFLKFFIGYANAPPFFDALLIGLNYSWGFVAMQLLHYALATKQPAMTAATIAQAISAQRDVETPELGSLVDLVARASRTQFTALMGNVLGVVPIALAIGFSFEAITGHHVLTDAYAHKTVATHHPIYSSTIFSAVWTGVWLWAASLIAGAAENYFVLRELPGAIASNRRLRRVVGAPRAARISRFLTQQASGFGGNIGFGMLLGFMPMLFQLVGLPLEVRHVTFVTGQLAYALAHDGPMAFAQGAFLLSLISIPMVGLLNFGVSFACAIFVALRAKGLGVRGQLFLVRAVATRFLRRPRDFFLAPKEPQSGELLAASPIP